MFRLKKSVTNAEAHNEILKSINEVDNNSVVDVAQKANSIVGIFQRVKSLCGNVKDVINVLCMIRDYVSGNYREVPWRVIAMATATMAYVLSPLDLLPDVIPIFGFVDDATVFSLLLSSIRSTLDDYIAWKAKSKCVDKTVIDLNDDLSSELICNMPIQNDSEFAKVVQQALSSMGQQTSFGWGWGPGISSEMRSNAYRTMNIRETANQIIGVINLASFGDGKEGCAFTDKALYIRNFGENPLRFRWREIVDFEREGKKIRINGSYLVCGQFFENDDNARIIFEALNKMLNRVDLTEPILDKPESAILPIRDAIIRRFATVPKGDAIFVGENIPINKRCNAHSSMEVLEPVDDICLLCDITLFGSGKSGFVATSQAFYIKDFFGSPVRIPWDDFGTPNVSWGNFVFPYGGDSYTVVTPSSLSKQESLQVCEALGYFCNYEIKANFEAISKKVESDIKKTQTGLKKAFSNLLKAMSNTRIDEWNSQRLLVSAKRVEEGVFELSNAWFRLDDVLVLGKGAKLVIKNADVSFGLNAYIKLEGGDVEIVKSKLGSVYEDVPENETIGKNLIVGEVGTITIEESRFSGYGLRSGLCVDGNVIAKSSVFDKLVNTNANCSVFGVPYNSNKNYRVSCEYCRFVNCQTTQQTLIWCMDAIFNACVFEDCSSSQAIVLGCEGCEISLRDCLFLRCKVGVEQPLVGCYWRDNYGVTTGGIVDCCIDGCNNKYGYNSKIPSASWISKKEYDARSIDCVENDEIPIYWQNEVNSDKSNTGVVVDKTNVETKEKVKPTRKTSTRKKSVSTRKKASVSIKEIDNLRKNKEVKKIVKSKKGEKKEI